MESTSTVGAIGRWLARSHLAKFLVLLCAFWAQDVLANSNWCSKPHYSWANSYQSAAAWCQRTQAEAIPNVDYISRACYTTSWKWGDDDRGDQGVFSFNYVQYGSPHGAGLDWYCWDGARASPAKDIGKPQCGTCVGDPIQGHTGNVFATEIDVGPKRGLAFKRYYNSSPAVQDVRLGPHWTHTYARRIRYTPGDGGSVVPNAVLVEDDGRELTYQLTDGIWSGEADVSDELSAQTDALGQVAGWTVRRVASQSVETYGADGVLLNVTDADGFTTTLAYDTVPAGQGTGRRLSAVTDAVGRSLTLGYNAMGRLASVSDAAGATAAFSFDANGTLASVALPGGTHRSYRYNEAGHAANPSPTNPLLTGIIDESGQRATTYDYDATDRGISTRGPDDASRYDLTFRSDGSTDVRDPLGQTRNHTFVVNSGTTYAASVDGPCASCGGMAARSYDVFGNLNQGTDFNGHVTDYTYDVNRLMTSRIEASGSPDQRITQIDWSARFKPVDVRTYDAARALVRRESSAYDAQGRLVASCEMGTGIPATYACSATEMPPAGVRRTVMTYCTTVDTTTCPMVGLLLNVDGPRADVTDTVSYSYYLTTDESGCATGGGTCHHLGDLQSITDGVGLVTTYVAYDKAGRVTRLRDPNGVLTDFTYTPRGWLASKTIRANASGAPSSADAVTTISYDPTGTVHAVTDADGVTTTYTYDAAHRLTDITDASGARTHFTLDAAGNRTAEQVLNATGEVVRSVGRTFNQLGQLTALTDGLNRTVFSAGFADSYDANGNLVHSQDGLGVQQKQVYDGLNRLISTLRDYQGGNAATANAQSVIAFDPLDHVRGFSDPDGLNTTYDVDALGQTTGTHSPDTGTTTQGFDIGGNPITRDDAASVSSTSHYDALNRLVSTTYADTSLNVTYTYDEDDAAIGCTGSAGKGRLTRILESSGGLVYCYDARGNVVKKQQTVGTTTTTTRYTWTLGNRLASITTANGTVISYARDGVGRIASVAATPASGTAASIVSDVSYQPFGSVATYTLGNGQTVTRRFDATGQLTDIASPAFSLHLARDAMGNITAMGPAVGASPASETYTYDALYRLTGVNDASGNAIEAYTYNKTGDRLSKAAPGLLTGNYTYTSGTHQLVGVGTTTRQVDARGNTTSHTLASGTWGYTYNGRNRLTEVQNNGTTVGSYVLNALGQRVQKTASGTGTRFDYDEDSRLLSEAGGTTTRDYVWLDDLPVGLVDRAGSAATIHYVHADGLGSPRAVTDASGAVQWQWPYAANPFGEKAPVSGSGYVLNLRFPGQYFDAESGLTYNVNRDYEAATGRYIQSDPIGLAGGTSTYLYTSGRPLTNSDPLGRDDSASMYNPDFWNPGSPLTGHSCDDGYWDRYRDRYIDWTADHVIDVGPYAAGLAGGLWPKSLAPATGGRPALLGSTNPLTSVPRGFGVPGANAPAVRAGAALIGVATVGIGIYDATVILEGFIYAIPEN